MRMSLSGKIVDFGNFLVFLVPEEAKSNHSCIWITNN